MKIPALVTFLAAAAVSGANQLPDSSFEYGNAPAFHRMRDRDYLAPYAWQPDASTAVDGSRSLRGSGGKTLRLACEVNSPLPTARNPWTFSVYLKADRPDTPVTLKAAAYRFFDQSEVKKTVKAGTEWQRHELTVREFRFGRRIGRNQGPVNFMLEIPKGVTVWADAAQWEPGQQATEYAASPVDHAVPRRELTRAATPPPMPLPAAVRPDRKGEIRLTVVNEGKSVYRNAPLSTGLLAPRGEFGSNTRYTLLDNAGRELPLQTAPLALHIADRSVLSLKLEFEAGLAPGENCFTLRYSAGAAAPAPVQPLSAARNAGGLIWHPSADPAKLWEKFTAPDGKTVIGPGTLYAVGIDNRRFRGVTETLRTETGGPLHTVVTAIGSFAAEDDPETVLLSYEARLHLRKGTPGVSVELTLTNRHPEQCIALREAGWRAELPEGGKADAALLQAFHPFSGKFRLGSAGTDGAFRFDNDRRIPLAMRSAGTKYDYRLQTRDGWKKHPTAIGIRDGKADVPFWPGAPVQPLLFTPGLAATRTSTLFAFTAGNAPDEAELAAQLDAPPVVTAEPAWILKAGVPLQLSETGKTPLLDRYLENFTKSGNFRPGAIENGNWYGLFNYGDHPGDGGWANLESYTDYSTLLRGLRTGDPETLRLGLAAAEHYRDIDINHNNNLAIMHSSNHVNGGSHFGHAWIQGVLLHYLLTGDPRSREVAYEAGNALLAMPPDSSEIAENRQLAYYLLTLADGCRVFGDSRYIDRFRTQLGNAEARLAAPPGPEDRMMQRTTRHRENCFFYWTNSGVVPFASWYGCMGLLKMYEITNDRTLLPHIRREVGNALDLELLYRVHLEELYPNLPAEKTLPLIASDYVGGRGSYFYPVLAAYARATGEMQYRDLALRVAYARILEGKLDGGAADILMTAPFADLPPDFDEAKVVSEVKSAYLDGAATELLNGDFNEVRSYAEMMTPKRADAVTPEWARDIPYPRHWHFNAGKEFTATEFMRYRAELYTLDAGTLRLNFDRSKWYAQTINFDSARIAFRPGIWKFRGKVKTDRNTGSASFAFRFSNFKDTRGVLILPARPGAKPELRSATPALPKLISHSVSEPGKDGFLTVEAAFEVSEPSVGHLFFTGSLLPGRERGHIEVREFEFKQHKTERRMK